MPYDLPGATLKLGPNVDSSECIWDFLVTLSKFRNLETLSLRTLDVYLTPGFIPAAVEGMSTLTHLCLNACHLEGEVPRFLYKLPLLTHLDLSCNRFDLPDNVSYFTNGGEEAVHPDIDREDYWLIQYYALRVYGDGRFSVADLLDAIAPSLASASAESTA
jgi:hypothetical protein